MNDSIFDPDEFLNSEVEGSNSTTVKRFPVGTETPATITDVGFIGGYSENMNDGRGGYWGMLKISWEITDDDVLELVGRKKATVRQTLFLDLTDDKKISTEEGDNVDLGRLRKALGINEGTFSPNMLVGKSGFIVIGDEVDRRDVDKPASEQQVYNNVTAVRSL